jgi:hypothetical protein
MTPLPHLRAFWRGVRPESIHFIPATPFFAASKDLPCPAPAQECPAPTTRTPKRAASPGATYPEPGAARLGSPRVGGPPPLHAPLTHSTAPA